MFKITTRQNLLSEYIFLEINYFNSKLTGSIIHCFHQFNENHKVSLIVSYPMLKSEDILSPNFFHKISYFSLTERSTIAAALPLYILSQYGLLIFNYLG